MLRLAASGPGATLVVFKALVDRPGRHCKGISLAPESPNGPQKQNSRKKKHLPPGAQTGLKKAPREKPYFGKLWFGAIWGLKNTDFGALKPNFGNLGGPPPY